jgi:flagellar basal-body rod protein FlgC
MPDHRLFAGMDASASALSAERLRMTVSSENLANAGSTRRLQDGQPYRRQRVVFREQLDALGRGTGRVETEVVDSPRFSQRYEPGHPDADPDTGIVVEADIDPILELTDLMVASKAYESNANAVKGFLRMYEAALKLGEP